MYAYVYSYYMPAHTVQAPQVAGWRGSTAEASTAALSALPAAPTPSDAAAAVGAPPNTHHNHTHTHTHTQRQHWRTRLPRSQG